jgi:hypothetical protein
LFTACLLLVNLAHADDISMGARMAAAYVADNPDHGVDCLIVAGIRNNGGYPLDGDSTLRKITLPVLDIYGADNGKDSDVALDRHHLVSPVYQQVGVAGGNHKFEGVEDDFVQQVVSWLQSR